MPQDKELTRRQIAGQMVRDKMIMMLMNYSPVRELKVADLHVIAEMARSLAFEAMIAEETSQMLDKEQP